MQQAIQFLWGFEPRTLHDVDPTLTALNYLRTVERQCGTKEGCAEGDCGACTVVLGEAVGERLRYRAVNACILFTPVLDGKQLLTVEHLKSADGLHPAQQAMVDCHGSQCGFCTPGFVMSLFALYHAEPAPARARINDALAGNLCRCTGYRPIVDAAARMYALPGGEVFADREAETVARLRELRRDEPLELSYRGRRYFAPRTADQLAALLERHPWATLLAGGTDVGLWVTKQHRTLETLIYTGGVDELSRVEQIGSCLEIGAAVTYTQALSTLGVLYPDLGEVLRRLGSVQIRNSGTLGGNIGNASPIGDSMPLLIALGASLVLRRGSARREVVLEDFFLDYRKTALEPGEFIECVRVPADVAGRQFRAYKISKRFDQDISAVCAAFALRLEGGRVSDIRIGLGGVAATPVRARHTEAALRGRPWTDATITAARPAVARDCSPLTDLRASREYRLRVASNLLRKFYLETSCPTVATRVTMAREVMA